MISKKPLKTFLFPAANILLGLFMVGAFYIAGLSVVRTFQVANISALNMLAPHPIDYLWEVNVNNASINKSVVRYYADYYEHLLKIFPYFWDANGILGYCYHYLGNDAKAIDYFKKAIKYSPLISWNYYNLAVIYISESRYQDASILFQKLLQIDPQKSLKSIFASSYVYEPLLGPGGAQAFQATSQHLMVSYKVSYDCFQLINQMEYDKEVEGIIKKMDLGLYAF